MHIHNLPGIFSLYSAPSITLSPGCRHPGNVENGRIIPEIAANDLYPPGKRIEFLCLDDYMLEGDGEAFCQLDSTWSHKKPVCVTGEFVVTFRSHRTFSRLY